MNTKEKGVSLNETVTPSYQALIRDLHSKQYFINSCKIEKSRRESLRLRVCSACSNWSTELTSHDSVNAGRPHVKFLPWGGQPTVCIGLAAMSLWEWWQRPNSDPRGERHPYPNRVKMQWASSNCTYNTIQVLNAASHKSKNILI